MSERKWLAWWEIPELIYLCSYYPYRMIYRYGELVETGGAVDSSGEVR